ncbi:hypothetical protein [Streptomyces sp. NPDC048643]|uniref:hypothetical protein n=1 Tax=Streptomyces sp. NPDC048643 TaxID=3155637 RepID=UPI00343CF799
MHDVAAKGDRLVAHEPTGISIGVKGGVGDPGEQLVAALQRRGTDQAAQERRSRILPGGIKEW